MPFLGPEKTAADLEQARAALESAYAAHGFKTVTVALGSSAPEHGIILLLVTEARIGHLNVVGSMYSSPDKIRAEAPSLAEGSVPNFNEVPKDIAALNQLPDRRVTPSLKAGNRPGTVDVDLDVVDHLPLHGSLELNNRQSEDTTPLRLVGSLSYDDLWQEGHSLSMSAQVAPQHPPDAKVFYASYLARFGSSPFSLLANGIRSDSNVATIGGTNVVGNGETFALQGMLTLAATDSFYSAVSFGANYKHFNNITTVQATQSGVPVRVTSQVPLTYFPFTLGSTTIFREKTYASQIDVSLTFTNPSWGSGQAQFDENRYQATPQQLYLRASATHTHDLPGSWQAFGRISTQLSDVPLVSPEQYALGGFDTVRGYYEAEVLGDYGVGGTLELRTPSIAGALHFGEIRPFDEWRFFAFADYGYARINQPLPEQTQAFQIASFGGGLNVRVYSFLTGNLTWADPIYKGPVTPRWGHRLLFRVLFSL
jgi:hemolysin activation/secretion protein